MISLASVNIPLKAYANIFDCLRTGRIGRGKYVDMFEEKAAAYFGVKHCIAVSNGTLADIIMLATLKEMHPTKTDVILPAFTFIAQANAVKWARLNPVFVDCDFKYKMDWNKVEVTDDTLCVFPCHLLGVQGVPSYGTDKLGNVPMIEDCCEAMGGNYFGEQWWKDGKFPKFGTIGIAGAFSMYPSHTITTGEGGLIVTNNDQFHKIARSIHNHGKWETQDFNFKYVGINAKMTNLQAAIGLELIDTIDDVNKKRRTNVEIYNDILGFKFYANSPHCYPIVYTNKSQRDDALKTLYENGIEARKLMGCIPFDEPFRKSMDRTDDVLELKYQVSKYFADNGLFLPVHQGLTEKQIGYICDVIKTTFDF